MSRKSRGTIAFTMLVAALLAPIGASSQTEPPPPLPERAIQFPDHEEFTLDNGLRVIVVSYGTQPVASVRLYVPGGAALVEPERAGLAGLVSTVLTRGTRDRSAEEISATIEGVGGSIGASGGQDFFSVSVVTLSDHLDTAFSLLEDVVLRAEFPPDEVELARRQTLSSLQAQLGQPQGIAARRFSSVVFGEHPYGTSSRPATVESLTREDLVDFRDRILQPDGALLVVAGAVDRDDIETRVRRHLGNWERGSVPATGHSAAPERDERRIYLVHRPGAVQSVIRIGHLGVEAHDPDYFPLVVMNRILGGGADARLFRILREERGWTYDVGSSFSRMADRGAFSISAEVRTPVTDSTVVEILEQMNRLRDERVPEEELDAARNFLAGSYPLRLETADQVGSQLATTLLLGLPITDITRFPDRIRAVTAEDVQRAARTHLHPDRAAIIVVGDAREILEEMEAVAPVSLFDLDGSPLSRDDVVGTDAATDWDASRLEAGTRTYRYFLEDEPIGNSEYRLEREGDEWVSTVSVTAMGSDQETELRFGIDDFAPRSLRQTQSQGPIRIEVDLRVEDGRLLGRVGLPPEMGGEIEYDREIPPGTLLPGMDEYALASSTLAEGTRLTIPYLDATSGETIHIQARVTGSETLSLAPDRTHDVWVVEITGGAVPIILYLTRDSPHMLVRQEFAGQPVRLDLIGMDPL